MKLDARYYDRLMQAAAPLAAMLREARQRELGGEPPHPLLQLRAGLAESPGWFLLQAAEFDPEPLTVETLRVRDIYASERIVAALLDLMASEGWFDRDAANSYALTPAGRFVLEGILRRRHQIDGTLLPQHATERLHDLLARVVAASLAAEDPPGVWCLAHSRHRAPPTGAPPLARLLHLFEDLNAFRDDAHMAAWRPLGVDGHEWEAFALVSAGEAHDAAGLFRALAYRGYTEGEYAAALAALATRSWLETTESGSYSVTAAGKAVRTMVEERTDAFFYGPWRALQQEELREFEGLLTRLSG
jgi:hypothetical protein